MKTLKEHIVEGLKIGANTKVNLHNYNYHPKDKKELIELVRKLIDERDNDADLNDIDTSKITDMSFIFYRTKFNGDISKWDTSKANNMQYMFAGSEFNGDISMWDISNVENMSAMFYNSEFTGRNGGISNWDVSKVEDMSNMFQSSKI